VEMLVIFGYQELMNHVFLSLVFLTNKFSFCKDKEFQFDIIQNSICIMLNRKLALVCLTVIFISNILGGCNFVDKSKLNSPDFYFKNATTLKGKHLKEKYMTPYSFKCFYSDKGFIGSMPLPDNNIVHLANLQSGTIINSTLHKGRGSGEILTSIPHIDFFNNKLYVCDIVTNKIKRISIDHSCLSIEDYSIIKYNTPTITAGMKAVSDSVYAIFGYSRSSHSILLADISGSIIDSLPYKILNDKKIDNSKVGTFYVSMGLSPDRKYLYVCNKTYNHVRKYNISDNSISFSKEYFLTKPKYKINTGQPVQTGDNMVFWGEIFIGEKYVYLVANPEYRRDFERRREEAGSTGKKYTALPDSDSYILVFDYDMNLLKSYLCDGHFTWIALTPDPSVIYAADDINHCLKEYTLTNLF